VRTEALGMVQLTMNFISILLVVMLGEGSEASS
jgi:hypothetical protein